MLPSFELFRLLLTLYLGIAMQFLNSNATEIVRSGGATHSETQKFEPETGNEKRAAEFVIFSLSVVGFWHRFCLCLPTA